MNLDALTPDELAELQAKIAQIQSGNPQPAPDRRGRRAYNKESIQYLEDDEIDALISASSHSPRDTAIFEVGYHHGLRASEVGLLDMKDIRLGQRSRVSGQSFDRIFIHRLKGGEAKDYVMTHRTSKAVRRWIQARGRAPGPLFPSRNARPISRRRLDELMKFYGQRAGIPPSKQHFHCLRHTAGMLMCEQADLVQAQDHLGHRDIRSTAIYGKVRSKSRTELGERLAGKW